MAAPTPPSTRTTTTGLAQTCYIRSDSPNSNQYGAGTYGTYYWFAIPPVVRRRVIMKFQTATLGIPQDAIITGAKFRLYVNPSPAGLMLRIYSMSYIAGQLIVPYGGTTWNRRNASTFWTNPGGDVGTFMNQFVVPSAQYYEIDVTTVVSQAITQNKAEIVFLIQSELAAVQAFLSTEFGGNPPSLIIEWLNTPRQRADLGAFILGKAQLGGSIPKLTENEQIGLSEQNAIKLHLRISESVSMTEVYNTAKDIFINFSDSFTLTEKYRRLSDYMAGILGRIQSLLPVTSADFCEMILESGHTISLNGTLCRAYVFIKQAGQKFDHEIITMPGDAVMFSCPDLGVAVGDEVIFDGLTYYVAGNINHLYDGNIIYVKSALQKERFVEPMPQVTGLVAGLNENGKVLLTWDDIPDIYQFKKFNIWISSGVEFKYLDSSTSTSYTAKNLIPNTAYWFIVQAIDVYGNAGSFSAQVQCGIDNTPPAAPTGVR